MPAISRKHVILLHPSRNIFPGVESRGKYKVMSYHIYCGEVGDDPSHITCRKSKRVQASWMQ